jgi:hypothetical protein
MSGEKLKSAEENWPSLTSPLALVPKEVTIEPKRLKASVVAGTAVMPRAWTVHVHAHAGSSNWRSTSDCWDQALGAHRRAGAAAAARRKGLMGIFSGREVG